ncbi:MAG: hypothetical protein R6V67_09790, partial [Spirochaetia bacterium]
MLPNHIPEIFCKRSLRKLTAVSLVFIVSAILPLHISGQTEEPAPDTGEVENSADEYLRKTVLMDIETASYYELKDWLDRIGLSTEGDKKALQSRLQNYYHTIFPELELKSKEESEKESEEKEILSIEKAGRLDFHPEGAEGEAEIRISGGVLIYMTDEETDSTHRIEAHSLVFNRSEALLSAEGEVIYEMEKGEKTERFSGEKISFHVENYRGIFLGGMSERERTIEEEEVSFYFRGAVIYRTEEDSVFLERGMLTSSTLEDPYYHLAADRFWILGPDEWAFSDALLYMGRVPIFYFPFFFHPGDDLIFHPSFGYRNVEGYYFQTTTYLMGRKKDTGRNENSLSFLQVMEENSSTYTSERQGLFLRQTNEPAPKSWVEDSDSYIKLFFDYYSYLGIFSGLDFDINNLGVVENLEAAAGAGLTDYIFPREGYEAYTSVYRDDGEEEYRRYVQEPWFLGSRLPFRFGFALNSSIQWNNLRWRLSFPLYSDPYFHNLFKERDEEILWGSLLQGEEVDVFNRDPLRNPVFASRLSYKVPIPSHWSLVSSLTVSRFDSSLSLKNVELPLEYTKIETSPENPLGFYYPEQVTPLNASVTMKGKIFETSSKSKDDKEDGTEREVEQFRPPWDTNLADPADLAEPANLAVPADPKDLAGLDEADPGLSSPDTPGPNTAETDSTRADKESFRLPEKYPDSTTYLRKSEEDHTHSLSYTLSPDFSVHSRYDDQQREDPSSVGFDPQFSYLDSSLYGLFSYNSRLFDSALVMKNNLSLRGRY